LGGSYYWFKKQIDKRSYYVSLKLKKDQEALLSARIKQVEEQVIANHFHLESNAIQDIGFLDYTVKYLSQKSFKKSLDRDKQRLLYVGNFRKNISLSKINKQKIQEFEDQLFAKKENLYRY